MYQLSFDPDVIIRTSDGAFIGCSTENPDYQDFLKWRAAGNQPMPADPLPEITIPTRLTPAEKLRRAGLTVEELKLLITEPVKQIIVEEHIVNEAPQP